MPLIPRCEPLVIGNENPTACVILLHGLTTSGLQFRPIAEYLATTLPNVQFILPSAPVRPITWANGEPLAGWYDLLGDNFLAQEDEQGIQSAVEYVQDLLNQQLAKGIDSKRLFLGGFSQGCAISLFAGTTFHQPLGGIFGLSGYLPLTEKWLHAQTDCNCQTPILWQHGSKDPLVTLAQIEQGKQLLSRRNAFAFQTYPIEHHITQAELDALAKWLSSKM